MNQKNHIMSLPDGFLEEFRHALQDGFKVKVTGLGIFSVTDFKARKGIDPVTKQMVDRPAFKKMKFRATLAIKEFLQTIK